MSTLKVPHQTQGKPMSVVMIDLLGLATCLLMQCRQAHMLRVGFERLHALHQPTPQPAPLAAV